MLSINWSHLMHSCRIRIPVSQWRQTQTEPKKPIAMRNVKTENGLHFIQSFGDGVLLCFVYVKSDLSILCCLHSRDNTYLKQLGAIVRCIRQPIWRRRIKWRREKKCWTLYAILDILSSSHWIDLPNNRRIIGSITSVEHGITIDTKQLERNSNAKASNWQALSQWWTFRYFD